MGAIPSTVHHSDQSAARDITDTDIVQTTALRNIVPAAATAQKMNAAGTKYVGVAIHKQISLMV